MNGIEDRAPLPTRWERPSARLLRSRLPPNAVEDREREPNETSYTRDNRSSIASRYRCLPIPRICSSASSLSSPANFLREIYDAKDYYNAIRNYSHYFPEPHLLLSSFKNGLDARELSYTARWRRPARHLRNLDRHELSRCWKAVAFSLYRSRPRATYQPHTRGRSDRISLAAT